MEDKKVFYNQGGTYYKFDFATETIHSVTNNQYNKGMVISSGISEPFYSMANSLSSSLNRPQPSGPMLLLSNEEEWTEKYNEVVQTIISSSINQ